MKRNLFLLLLVLIMTMSQVMAAPARRQPVTITQPDGTTITVQLQGDEFHHFYTTIEGDYVTLCNDGYVRYTTIDADNNLVAGDVVAGNSAPASIKNMRGIIAARHMELQSVHRQIRAIRADHNGMMRRAAQKTQNNNSDVKGLIVLVNFNDKSFVTPAEVYRRMMNEEGYTDEYGSIGSARDYFIDQSYGSFNPSFDIVGPITLSKKMSYYGGNDSRGQDNYPHLMVSEACQIASEQGLVDMSDYDLDGDGWVDLIYVIYAGYGENVSGVSTTAVWPHAWYIYQGAGESVKVDGVFLDAYACSAELSGSSGSTPDGIGTFCHEYSHTLGLPDLYDIDYSGGVGMNEWSVMDQGCYAMDGYVPIAYSAYERYSCGWLDLNELNDACSIIMNDINKDKTDAYRISSTDENQFITLETRTMQGWDMGLPAEGVMITAIDYDAKVWNDNAPNDRPSRQRVQLIPADNDWDEWTLYGDLYPYYGNNSLTSSSAPSMSIYTTTIENKPVTNITYNDGTATFDFMGGSNAFVEAPVATAASDVSYDCFTAYWSPVSNATSYTLYVERVEETVIPEFAFEEYFDNFINNPNTDITNNLDNYTTLPGWTGYKVFCNDGEVKLGSSSSYGQLITPAIDMETDNTISFKVRCYSSKDMSGTLTIKITNDEYTAKSEIAMSQLSYENNMIVSIPNSYGKAGTTIEFYCTKRLYLDDIRVLNSIDDASIQQHTIVLSPIIQEVNNDVCRKDSRKAQVVTESAMFEGITTNYYKVNYVENDIYPGKYRYKVRAVSDNGFSAWSNTIDVNTMDFPDSAITPDSDTNYVYAHNGNIYIINTTSKDIVIYNMQGCVVATLNTSEGTTTFTPATAGIYIVQCDNNVSKVVVR